MKIYFPLKALVAASAALSICASAATAGAAPSVAPARTDSAIRSLEVADSVISARDRTRPFLPGEKLLYFTNIKNGDQIRSPFRVALVVSGMGVSPVIAGDIKDTGHHHILI